MFIVVIWLCINGLDLRRHEYNTKEEYDIKTKSSNRMHTVLDMDIRKNKG